VVILVTGGAGFIGSFVVDLLVDAGHEVRVVDVLHPGAHEHVPEYLHADADYRWGDLADPDVARDAVRGIDAVCHQASMVGLGTDFADVSAYVHHNDVATAVLLGALHDHAFAGRVVLASSMVVYGEGAYRCAHHGVVRPAPRRAEDLARGEFDPTCPACSRSLMPVRISENALLEPRSVYAATKLHQEHLCACWGREHDTSVIALRYHNVYGPRMPADTPYSGVAAIFRSALQRGLAPKVYEDGAQLRDFVHVEDIARANVLALEARGDVAGACNIASGEPHTILDLAEALTNAVGEPTMPVITGTSRGGDVRHVLASPERAARMLGFRATVPFVRGIEDFATAPLRGLRGGPARIGSRSSGYPSGPVMNPTGSTRSAPWTTSET